MKYISFLKAVNLYDKKDINLWRNNLTILVPKVNIVMFFISRNLKDIHVVLEIFDFELNYFCAHNEGN